MQFKGIKIISESCLIFASKLLICPLAFCQSLPFIQHRALLPGVLSILLQSKNIYYSSKIILKKDLIQSIPSSFLLHQFNNHYKTCSYVWVLPSEYINHDFLEVLLLSQVNPSWRPSPVRAHVPWMFHSLPLRVCSPSFSTTSETLITHMSCLLARTSKTASLSQSSASIFWSSSRAIQTLSLSEESTTQMRACVFWQQCFQSCLILSCPPTSHTVNFTFWNSTVSTLNPMVGTDDTTSPSLSLQRMVVLPAASRPNISALSSFFPKRESNNFVKLSPI